MVELALSWMQSMVGGALSSGGAGAIVYVTAICGILSGGGAGASDHGCSCYGGTLSLSGVGGLVAHGGMYG